MKKSISILLLTLIVSVCSAQSPEYSLSEKYNVEAPAKLSIAMEDGNVSVFSSKESDIGVNFIAKRNKKLIKIDRMELEKHFDIEVKKSQNSIEILCEPTQKEINMKWDNRIILSLEILVPENTSCSLKTVDGNLVVKGLQANLTCKTVDGNIHLSNIKGIVNATTSDGNVSFRDIEGEFTAVSYDGNLSGKLSVLNDNLSISTNDGNIDVKLPEGLGLNLKLKADVINTELKNFDGKVEEEQIKGILNGGGISVKISSLDGNLSLHYE